MPTLLVLDGLEAMLHGPGEQGGEFRDDVLPGFLERVKNGGRGFCVLTSRVVPAGIAAHGEGKVLRLDLQHLGREHTRRLLRELGVDGLPVDLEAAVNFTRGHPLLIRLLASRFVAEGSGSPLALRMLLGELRSTGKWTDRWTEEDPELARMLRTYVRWFSGMPELALLRLCSIFDRLPEEKALRTLLENLRVLGEDFSTWQNLPEERWQTAAEKLRDCGLVFAGAGLVLEMHPLVQSFFMEEGRKKDRAGTKAAHGLLYEHFRAAPEKDLPDTLEEMQPLLQAVHHGCQAGRYQAAWDEIAWPRLSRDIQAYIIMHLGAYQETKALMGCFCVAGWKFPEGSDLSPENRGGILQAVAHCERVADRLDPAIKLMRRCVREASRGSDPLYAATGCIHIVRMAMMRGKMRLGLAYLLRLRWLMIRKPKFFGVAPQTLLEREVSAYFSSILACFLLIAGRKKDAEPLLAKALETVRQDRPGVYFLPKLAMPFHAFWLIETGRNDCVLQAIENGETEFSIYQYEFNNGASLVKGMAWTRQTMDSRLPPSPEHAANTRRTLDFAGRGVAGSGEVVFPSR